MPPGPVTDPTPDRCDVVVVGAGILGLASARELTRRHPGLNVAVLEREPGIARHQTGQNSGVVHAGIYYKPGSLKARLCVEGARELYELCAERGIAHERCGKVIVATTRDELPALDELESRGRANGVPGLRRLDRDELRAIEPHATGVAALHSPNTGIADFPAVAGALAQNVREAGGSVTTGCEVTKVDGSTVTHAHGRTEARGVIVCAGGWADRLAVSAGAPADPRIVPFRGAYLRLTPSRRHLVNGLIYPVPDPRLPFLGVHLTKHVDGEVLVGPTAMLVPRARSLAWPGTWRMMRRFWRTGIEELHYAASRRALVRAARAYVPELDPDDVVAGPVGIRAQALARDG
ncbi:MAG: (S)-2-hydroxyglutarate dehydrogenase, partial [Thermoleophilaceae bacterium]|nr:(S)-2-hydroxyglutarate dehydrogenase [Thermoleophilaceae bacterium]